MKKPSLKLSLGAMVTALTVLFLYASEVLVGFRWISLFFCAFFVQLLLCEGYVAAALISFFASALLGFILCPDRISWFLYVALLGHYGTVRYFFRRFITVPVVRSLFTVLYCNVGVAFFGWLLYTVAGVNVLSLLPKLPLPLFILLLEAAFFLIDVLYEGALRLYVRRFRKLLLPKR